MHILKITKLKKSSYHVEATLKKQSDLFFSKKALAENNSLLQAVIAYSSKHFSCYGEISPPPSPEKGSKKSSNCSFNFLSLKQSIFYQKWLYKVLQSLFPIRKSALHHHFRIGTSFLVIRGVFRALRDEFLLPK